MYATILSKIKTPYSTLVTFELEFPRFILAEFSKHRMFSFNCQSSRAVPLEKNIENILENPPCIVSWLKNKSGMSGGEGYTKHEYEELNEIWRKSRDSAIEYARELAKYNLNKQLVNRILEPYTNIKMVCSSTEWKNFYFLRNHPDAQPEIRYLASMMKNEDENFEPFIVNEEDLNGRYWNTPYFNDGVTEATKKDVKELLEGNFNTELGKIIKISSASIAQVSYRKLDQSDETIERVWNKLVNVPEGQPIHAVCLEHIATPLSIHSNHDDSEFVFRFVDTLGVGGKRNSTFGDLWSGNFRNFGQLRKLLAKDVW